LSRLGISNCRYTSLVHTPGIGVGLIDVEGNLLYLNDEETRLFEGHTDVDYAGKNIRDFHAESFCKERLELLGKVVEKGQPLVFRHIYLGKKIESTLWPIKEIGRNKPRVLVISRGVSNSVGESNALEAEVLESQYIKLGPLNVLSPRELEVFVMLGHGRSVPEVARILHRSPKTIERHRESIGQKLSIQSQSDIVRIVTEVGLSLSDVGKIRL
jgi:DNA-binding CsgD family transcriptional regulator